MAKSAETINLQFNGQPLEVPAGLSVAQLLELTEMRSQVLAVEVNQAIVPREEHSSHGVQAGDVIEAVTLVGGG